MVKGTGDPTYNTTPPTGVLANSGWQYQGFWGTVLGTVIGPHHFIAAQHVGGGVGQGFIFNGVTYTTTAYWDDTNSDLRIWQVDGTFPTFAPLYTTLDEVGKSLVVFGRGTQRGEQVFVNVSQTNYYTNTVDLKSLGISKKVASQEFPNATFRGSTMTVVTSVLVTNTVPKGWKASSADHVMRWGENQVLAAGGLLVASFDSTGGTNEAYLSAGDSSGAVFIQDGGVWKLAGINYAVQGPFALSSTDPAFYGAIFDESGLYVDGSFIPNGQCWPACFYASRISSRLAWIQSVLGQ